MASPHLLTAWLLVTSPTSPIELVAPESALVFDAELFSSRLGEALGRHTGRPVRLLKPRDSAPVAEGSRVVVLLLAGVRLCRLVAERAAGSTEPMPPVELTTGRCAEFRAEGLAYDTFAKLLFPESVPSAPDGGPLAVDKMTTVSSAHAPTVLASVGGALAIGGMVAIALGLNAVDDPPHPFDYQAQRDLQRVLLIGGGSGLAVGLGLITAALFDALVE